MGFVMLGEATESLASTLWHSRRGQSRATFEAWQPRRLAQWLRKAVPRVAAYSHAPEHLDDFPITDKATLMANFGAYNHPGISAAQAWDALIAKDRLDDYIVGASTGTNGNRRLFVVSEQEQFRWLGTILAKTISDMLWRTQRVAII
ncbi:MAG: phenylacetate-coenzyme A ligase PaaK-like adenylate-forming protein [Yoonia sp.]|jgi:phenylacetate-coenzyme A ligase PaaK-like adenylate-forming protein